MTDIPNGSPAAHLIAVTMKTNSYSAFVFGNEGNLDETKDSRDGKETLNIVSFAREWIHDYLSYAISFGQLEHIWISARDAVSILQKDYMVQCRCEVCFLM